MIKIFAISLSPEEARLSRFKINPLFKKNFFNKLIIITVVVVVNSSLA